MVASNLSQLCFLFASDYYSTQKYFSQGEGTREIIASWSAVVMFLPYITTGNLHRIQQVYSISGSDLYKCWLTKFVFCSIGTTHPLNEV